MKLSLIYKQWHRAPNRKKTPASNCGHLCYIGQRVHVMKPESQDNGLFGRLHDKFSNNIDIDKTERYLHKLSRNQFTVYRSVISFKQETVDHLEMDTADKWQNYAEYNARILAEKNGIKFENFEYLAAVHQKAGQPHIHFIFWDKAQQIGKSIVDSSVPDSIRRELISSTFTEEELQWVDEIETETDSELMGEITADTPFYSLDNANDVRKGIIKQTFEKDIKKLNKEINNTEEFYRTAIQNTLDIKPQDIIVEQLKKIIRLTPKTGSLKYINIVKFDVPLKTEIDRLTDMLMATNPDILSAYNKILENKEILAEIFNSTDTKAGRYETAKIVGKAKDNLYAVAGNRILQQVKSYLNGFDTKHSEINPDITMPDTPPLEYDNTPPEDYDNTLPDEYDLPDDYESITPHSDPHIEWSKDYKSACRLIYDKSSDKAEYNSALRLLLKEHESGNVLATYDIGKMYSTGLFGDDHKELADGYYRKAFDSFTQIYGEKGNEKMQPYIEYRLGKMYSRGIGTEQDYNQAFDLFKQAADAKNKYAQFSLAGLYYYGNGVELDYSSALEYYEKAAAQGMPFAAYSAAQMYDYGTGCDSSRQKADALYKSAYNGFLAIDEKGDADDNTLYRLGTMLISGKGCETDTQSGLDYIHKAAELENKNALAIYARELAVGASIPQNLELSAQCFEKAIEKENKKAVYEYGKLLIEGNTFERNPDKAIPLLETAAAHNTVARYYLAKLYLRGELIGKDIPKSIQLLTKCVEENNQFAMYTLASIYAYEDGYINPQKAFDNFKLAAEQDNIYACYEIGKLSEQYSELNIPDDVAQEFYKRAFDGFMLMELNGEGNDRLWLRIGCMYLKGNGVEKSVDTAMNWLKKSADAGNETAKAIIEQSENYLANNALMSGLSILRDFGRMCDDGDRDINHAQIYGHGDLSPEAVKDLIYKLKDKQNGMER